MIDNQYEDAWKENAFRTSPYNLYNLEGFKLKNLCSSNIKGNEQEYFIQFQCQQVDKNILFSCFSNEVNFVYSFSKAVLKMSKYF